MRIVILCNDTRGGVQPYAALARGLVAAGHEVSAVAPEGLAGLFGTGLRVTVLAGTEDPMAFAATGLAEGGTRAAMALMARELPRRLAGWRRTTLAACERAEMLTGGIGGMAIGLAVAETLRLPFVPTHLQPVGHATTAYPGVLFPGAARWGAAARWLSHKASDAGVWLPFRSAMAQVRRETFGLTGRWDPTAGQPVIYGFSRLWCRWRSVRGGM